jgi:hemolysin III
MHLLELREPVNAWSHGIGMMLALPVTWVLLKGCTGGRTRDCAASWSASTTFGRIKAFSLFVFGLSLIACYGISAAFHGVSYDVEFMRRLQRLDHVGIYLLIAGTYTPIAWGLLRDRWLWGTLSTVWSMSLLCAARVWWGNPVSVWVSTSVYLAMGWGAVFCYRELLRQNSHRRLLPLPIGGIFYSVGAIINLARWPVFFPGLFGPHELFHLLVIAGSASHVFFMFKVILPTSEPMPVFTRERSRHSVLPIRESLLHRKHGTWRMLARWPFRSFAKILAGVDGITVARDRMVENLPSDRAIEAA